MAKYSLHFDKRENVSWHSKVLNPVLCIILALLFCGIIVSFEGHNPIVVYQRMFKNAFGSSFSILESILQAIPLMFCSLGVSVAFRMSINNIGAEGQFAMGAFAATAVALYFNSLPHSLVIPTMIICGFAAGALWAVITILPKVFLGVNETIVTLMSNYIALLF
ncbi:MAG: ABC transporter permease, partial [Candidatus Ornithospirochaeta sp.]